MGVRSADAIGDVASRSCLSEHPAVANIKAGIESKPRSFARIEGGEQSGPWTDPQRHRLWMQSIQ
jgi:hypothetical protein